MESTDSLKNYFLYFIKGSKVIPYIKDYHVSQVTIEGILLGIGLSSDYKTLRFYEIDESYGARDHRRFKSIILEDGEHHQEYIIKFI